MKNKGDFIKVIGVLATVVGMGATLLSNWVEDQRMDERINDRVDEAFKNYFTGIETTDKES